MGPAIGPARVEIGLVVGRHLYTYAVAVAEGEAIRSVEGVKDGLDGLEQAS